MSSALAREREIMIKARRVVRQHKASSAAGGTIAPAEDKAERARRKVGGVLMAEAAAAAMRAAELPCLGCALGLSFGGFLGLRPFPMFFLFFFPCFFPRKSDTCNW